MIRSKVLNRNLILQLTKIKKIKHQILNLEHTLDLKVMISRNNKTQSL